MRLSICRANPDVCDGLEFVGERGASVVPATLLEPECGICRAILGMIQVVDEQERSEQIGLAVAGDADALQRLIMEYHGPLGTSIQQMINARIDPARRRHVTAEDVLQEAYAAANRTIKSCRFSGPAAFYKWLETIALRKVIDVQKAAARLPKGESAAAPGRPTRASSYLGLSKMVADTGDTPSRALRQEEGMAALLSGLARLPDNQRTAIRLRFLEEMPVTEVARNMDSTAAAVYGLCRQGLRWLRENMDSISR